METHDELRSSLKTALVDMGRATGDGFILPGSDQMLTNALGITLGLRWALANGATARLHTYAPRHQNERASHFTDVPAQTWRHFEPNWHRYSFLLDLYVEEWSGSRKDRTEHPIVGAEIEAYPNHGVDDNIDTNDYQWDFYKLLHVRVPRRLFVACARKDRLVALERTLVAAHERTRQSAGARGDRLAILLLPGGEHEWNQVRLGVSHGRNQLRFVYATQPAS